MISNQAEELIPPPYPKSKARPQVNPCGGHNLGSVSQAAGLCILNRGEAAGMYILYLLRIDVEEITLRVDVEDRVQRGHADVDVRKNILRYKSKYIKI